MGHLGNAWGAGATLLGHRHARLALEHPHRRCSGRSAGDRRALPLRAASQLRGGHRRDGGLATGARGLADRGGVHAGQCLAAPGADRRRGAGAGQVVGARLRRTTPVRPWSSRWPLSPRSWRPSAASPAPSWRWSDPSPPRTTCSATSCWTASGSRCSRWGWRTGSG